MDMDTPDILRAINRTGELLQWNGPVEVLLIGGAAGMMTGLLSFGRMTHDCDLIRCEPEEAMQAIETAARIVAAEMGLPDDWFNAQSRQLDILPDGWRNRQKLVGKFGLLHVYAVGRLDLLAMKFYANRVHDRQDLRAMGPQREELTFVRTYLNMLRVPKRQANLDQVQSALRLLAVFEKEIADE